MKLSKLLSKLQHHMNEINRQNVAERKAPKVIFVCDDDTFKLAGVTSYCEVDGRCGVVIALRRV